MCAEGTHLLGFSSEGNLVCSEPPPKGEMFCGSAASFTGRSSTDTMSIAGSGGLHLTNGFTIEARVNFKSFRSPRSNIVDKYSGSGTGREYRLAVNPDGRLRMWYTTDGTRNGAVTLVSANPLPLNQWAHVAATYDGTQMKVFIDGRLEGTRDLAKGPAGFGNQNVAIGGNNCCSGYNEVPNALLDEIRVSDIARYTGDFSRPEREFTPDANSLLLMHFTGNTNNEGLIGGAGTLNGSTSIVPCTE